MNRHASDILGFSIYHDLIIHASLEKVFCAITNPKELINWWPLKCSGEPKLNESYNFYFTDEYDWYGKVTEITTNKSFQIKMTKSDSDWNNTIFGFKLNSIGTSVRISFYHKGWPKCNEHYRRSSFCWAMLLNGLKNYLERGIIIPFEERA